MISNYRTRWFVRCAVRIDTVCFPVIVSFCQYSAEIFDYCFRFILSLLKNRNKKLFCLSTQQRRGSRGLASDQSQCRVINKRSNCQQEAWLLCFCFGLPVTGDNFIGYIIFLSHYAYDTVAGVSFTLEDHKFALNVQLKGFFVYSTGDPVLNVDLVSCSCLELNWISESVR